MLWYKYWRESRPPFVISALAIASLCCVVVLYHKDAQASIFGGSLRYTSYIWQTVYKSYIKDLFVLLVLFLGAGGLMRESAEGTAVFTLSFPTGRRRLVTVRAIVGFVEVGILALLPALIIAILSPLVHESYPFFQAIQFTLLWAVCGILFCSMALVASIVFGGEYTAPLVALLALALFSIFVDIPGVERYIPDIHDIMSGAGMSYFRAEDSTLIGPLPWRSLAVILLIASGLVVLAGEFTRRQDF